MNNSKLIKIILPGLLLINGFWLSSCSDKAKEILNPIFDLAVEISLSDKTYKMSDIVKRQSQVTVDSGSSLLRFSTDEIRKDTTLEAFTASELFDLSQDTTFQLLITDTIDAQMIIRRDSIRVDEAEVDSGLINYQITNYSDKNSSFELVLPGFTRENGQTKDTLKLGGNINAGQTLKITNDIAGFKYKQPPNQPFGSTRPGFWIRVHMVLLGGSPGDSIKLFSEVQNLKFRRVQGTFKPISLGLKEQTFQNLLSKDISEFVQKVTFDSINVSITGKTTIDFPVRLRNFQVIGTYNSGAQSIKLLFSGSDSFDTLILPNSTITLNFNNLNTNVNEFLAGAPDSLKIISELILNPLYLAGEVLFNDTISFSFHVDAWSKFSVNNASFTDTLELDIGQDARDKLQKGVSGSMFIHYENKIPLEVELKGLLTDSLYRPLFYLTRDAFTSNDSVSRIEGAFVDADGRVIGANSKTIQIDLTQDEIHKMKDAYFLIQTFGLSTTDKRTVYLSSRDEVKIRIAGKVKVKFDSDDF